MQHPTINIPLPNPGGKKVYATFDIGSLSTDAGLAFVRQVDDRLGLTASLAGLLPDPRNPLFTVHSHLDLFRQRVYSIVAGYEDTNDAKTLRGDPALKLATGRDPMDPLEDLGSQSSLCRFEHRITAQSLALMEMTYYEGWLKGRAKPKRLILDADSTWEPTHGDQQLAFFNAHYDSYGYHPILIFDTETADLLVAHLRPGNVGAAEGVVPLLEGIVQSVRAKWPGVPILFRADAGFAGPELYDWCEANQVDYIIGLGINPVLKRLSAECLKAATAQYVDLLSAGKLEPGELGKAFTEFKYQAESWSKPRRVIAKAEFGPRGDNQRYVVTSLKGKTPRQMYTFYGQRGQSENWIKNLKNALAGDRLSCSEFLPNAFRLLLHAVAYRLCLALADTVKTITGEIWQFDTLRLRLIKVAGLFVEQARRVLLHLPSACPYAALWEKLWRALAPPRPQVA
jgi:hypothetical protein